MIIYGALFIALLVVAFLIWCHFDAKSMVKDFEKAFPGRCVICSYHRYGIQEGLVRPGTPVPEHEGCPEKK